MTNQEKRRHQRFSSLNLSYVCLDEEQRTIKQGMGRTLNLSEAGILLETHFPISKEHHVVLSIGLGEDLVDLRGRPVHVRATGQGTYEIGIEFVNPGETPLRAIREFVQSLQSEE